MYIPNYPEDSTLRRHHASAAEFQRQEFLARPPTDSVLRRHYEQRLNAAAPTATPRTPTPEAARSSPPRSPAHQPTTGGGFLAWLRRLFG